MIKWIVLLGLIVVGGVTAYQFYALDIFNFLIPKDSASQRVAQDVSFGPDPRLKLDVYAPREGSGPWPVVVFVHGGSWSSGSKDPYEFVGRALAAQGYLTLLPQYRLHPEHKFPAFVEDTALAIDWATRHVSEYGGNQQRVFVTGHSAGAYNVALAVLDKSYLTALGTDTSAIKGVALLSAPLDFLPLDTAVSIDVFQAVADLPTTQPITYARADVPPFLLLHGSADTTCLPKNSINLNKRLLEKGADSTLKLYDGVSHVDIMLALSKPLRGRAPTLQDLTDFLKSH